MGRYPGKSFDKNPRGNRRGGDNEMFEATCDDCGGTAKLPFKPSSDKPVYCSKCFEKHDNKHQDRRSRGDRERGSRGGSNNRKVVEQLEKLNNNIENLEMMTTGDNSRHAIETGLWRNLQGENSHLNKYSEDLVKEILRRVEMVERYPNGNIKAGELIKIAEDLGTTRHVVKNYTRKRKIWKHLQKESN